MKSKEIKAGSFYILATGETVRVEGPSSDVKGWFDVWELDSQEPYAVPPGMLVRECDP